MSIQCPACGTVNEATVRNDLLRPGISERRGPVWTCNIEGCLFQWTDDEAEAILDAVLDADCFML